ncbi:MAG: hypothetical protein ABI183_25850 [Polyangiaceae bacterium]
MKPSRIALTMLFFASIGVVSLAACSPGTESQKAGAVSVTFPSTKAAIATDTIELRVFDANAPGNDCLTLIQTEEKTQPLPKPIYDSGKVDTCAFFANQVKPFDMGYGARSFIVVGQRSNADFVLGCTTAGIGDVANSVNVELSLNLSTFAPTTQVPDSATCSSLGDRCTKNIKCY